MKSFAWDRLRGSVVVAGTLAVAMWIARLLTEPEVGAVESIATFFGAMIAAYVLWDVIESTYAVKGPRQVVLHVLGLVAGALAAVLVTWLTGWNSILVLVLLLAAVIAAGAVYGWVREHWSPGP